MSIQDKIQQNVLLAPLTTFKIGGPARFFVEVTDLPELFAAIEWAKEQGEPIFVLGGGSNILVSDQGFAGLVIRLKIDKLILRGTDVLVGAGALMSQVVLLSIDNELAGMEWAVGLPGTVGGAVWGNAGCFGSGMHQVVSEVEYLDLKTLKLVKINNHECDFSYHESVFSKNNWLILGVIFSLEHGHKERIQERVTDIISKGLTRKIKAPTAGCVFRNFSFAELQEANPEIYREAVELNKIRDGGIAAGWLIDHHGLKGKTIGGAKISDIHANFIINESGKATAEEVVMLISQVKQQIRDSYGVQLHEEIQYVGF